MPSPGLLSGLGAALSSILPTKLQIDELADRKRQREHQMMLEALQQEDMQRRWAAEERQGKRLDLETLLQRIRPTLPPLDSNVPGQVPSTVAVGSDIAQQAQESGIGSLLTDILAPGTLGSTPFTGTHMAPATGSDRPQLASVDRGTPIPAGPPQPTGQKGFILSSTEAGRARQQAQATREARAADTYQLAVKKFEAALAEAERDNRFQDKAFEAGQELRWAAENRMREAQTNLDIARANDDAMGIMNAQLRHDAMMQQYQSTVENLKARYGSNLFLSQALKKNPNLINLNPPTPLKIPTPAQPSTRTPGGGRKGFTPPPSLPAPPTNEPEVTEDELIQNLDADMKAEGGKANYIAKLVHLSKLGSLERTRAKYPSLFENLDLR